MLKTKGFIEPKGSKRYGRMGEGLGWFFFWDWLNVHTFDSRHRADRRVKVLVAEWVGGGMCVWVGWVVCKS